MVLIHRTMPSDDETVQVSVHTYEIVFIIFPWPGTKSEEVQESYSL